MGKLKFSNDYEIDHATEHEPRNIIILMDGTWNDETGKDGSRVVTNIVKLYRMLEDSEHQVTRYFRGVGNDEDNSVWARIKGGAFGAGEKQIRKHAYATICKEYRKGDQILIFGFSRGAASARMLAADISHKGIPDRVTIEMETKENRFTHAIEYRFVKYEPEGKNEVYVDFLGVWDTVGAFGIPIRLFGIPFNKWDLFRDMTVGAKVQRTVHLVGIDETRNPYEPTLMNHNPAVVHEVWFPGVHSDVGGGYKEDELGRITLRYMIDYLDAHCAKEGLPAIRYKEDIYQAMMKSTQEPTFHFHGIGYKKDIRKIFVQQDDKPNDDLQPQIHDSVQDLQRSSEVFSLRKKKQWFRKDTETLHRIVYNPPNVKTLDHKYVMVSNPSYASQRSGRLSPKNSA